MSDGPGCAARRASHRRRPGSAIVSSMVALLVGAASMTMATGCASTRDTTRGSDARVAIDEELELYDPALAITPLEAGQWALELEIGRPDQDGSRDLAEVARRIARVDFVLFRPGARRVDSLVRTELAINAEGVRGAGSPVVYSGVKWAQAGLIEGDEYVMMTIVTDRGVVVRSGALFGEWPRGFDSTRLSLRLSLDDDSVGLHVRRRLLPAGDEFVTGASVRMALRDSKGEIVWSAAGADGGRHPRPALPDRVGDSVAVRFAFDRRDARTGREIPPGRYTLTGEVSTMPRAYFIHEEISWGGR